MYLKMTRFGISAGAEFHFDASVAVRDNGTIISEYKSESFRLAKQIAGLFAERPEVEAIALGGSRCQPAAASDTTSFDELRMTSGFTQVSTLSSSKGATLLETSPFDALRMTGVFSGEAVVSTKTGFLLWLRWVVANALAELVGLGATFALDILILARVAAAHSILASILGIIAIAVTGAIEGTVVGLLQWSVLRHPFPLVTRRAWVVATVIGAVIAWFLGSLPSTLMDMGSQESSAPVQEPSQAVMLLLAAGMGLFLGVVLGYPQWRELRRAVRGAWLWIPANSLAWALGMPAIFAAVDRAYAVYATGSPGGAVAVMAAALALAGAIVGAVHGLALVKLARSASHD